MDSELGVIEQSFNVRYSSWVREALEELPDSFVVTDPCICGHPIVYASSGFLKVFGYSKDEVVGKNRRMFQGPNTNRRSVMEIREAIREERDMQISLLNYRKDGTPFWRLFRMCPVFSKEDGMVVYFVGVQVHIFSRRKLYDCQNFINFSKEGSGNHNVAYRYCRREVCSESGKNLTHTLAMNSMVVSDSGGYARHEVLGRNCRFLRGPDTDRSTGLLITEWIESERACTKRQNIVLELSTHLASTKC